MPVKTRVLVVVCLTLAAGMWAPVADAAFVGKKEARAYLVDAVRKGGPRVMLGGERGRIFRTAKLWVQRAERCRRRSEELVTCRFVARLQADPGRSERNWWPITCRGSVTVGRLEDGRLQGDQNDYVCRTTRR